MNDTDTITPAERLARYRSDHRIYLVDERHPEFGPIHRCAMDQIRVHATRNGRWYHDPSELKELLDANYGRPDSWGRERAIERILESMPDREPDEDEPEFDRNPEGDPTLNGAFR